MTGFRSKPTGWRYESARHSLAARGFSQKDEHMTYMYLKASERMQQLQERAKYLGLTLKQDNDYYYLNGCVKGIQQRTRFVSITDVEKELVEREMKSGLFAKKGPMAGDDIRIKSGSGKIIHISKEEEAALEKKYDNFYEIPDYEIIEDIMAMRGVSNTKKAEKYFDDDVEQ